MVSEIQEITTPRLIPNYDHIIEDLRSIIITTENNARSIVLEGYHELGTEIIKYGLNKPEFMSLVAHDLGKSKRTIYRVLQMVEKWKTIDEMYSEVGMEASWHKVCNVHLIGKTEDDDQFSINLDELTAYLYENCSFVSKNALFTKNGVTIRITREQLERYMEDR